MSEREHAIELYLHIPFCVRKCGYCDFLSFPSNEESVRAYLRALQNEIRASAQGVSAGMRMGASEFSTGMRMGASEFSADMRTGASEFSADMRTGASEFSADMRTGVRRPRVSSIFLGGGTPSLLAAEQVAALMETVRTSFDVLPDAEISIEVNPGTADAEKLRAFTRAGINRMSIGCQSFSNDELRMLGRIHDRDAIFSCFYEARAAGCGNINLDLISAVPGQDLAGWKRNLEEAAALAPEHISAYSLIIEDGTPFADARASLPLPDEETERAMYEETAGILANYGFEQYEISNYAKPGFECRHNIGYWTGVPYLGCGLGAASFLYVRGDRINAGSPAGQLRKPDQFGVDSACEITAEREALQEETDMPRAVRYSNVRDMHSYIAHYAGADAFLRCAGQEENHPNHAGQEENHPIHAGQEERFPNHAGQEESLPNYAGQGGGERVCNEQRGGSMMYEEQEELCASDLQAEYMILGLRLTRGVSIAMYERRFGLTPQERYGEIIARHEADGLLEQADGYIRLTKHGRSLANRVMADFL